MKISAKICKLILIIGVVAVPAYYYRADIASAWQIFQRRYLPCRQPIAYSLGDFDDRFKLSREEFLADIKQAESIWESAAGRDLFNFASDGRLKINPVYDSRQEATDRLSSLGLKIENNQASFDSLKARYEASLKNYNVRKTQWEKDYASYERQKADYEKQVSAINARGGATPAEFARLEKDRQDLNNQAQSIQSAQAELKRSAEDLNSLVSVLNRMINEMNMNIDNYNSVGEAASGEWQEGEYVSGAEGEEINVYQFNDRKMLVRLLAHEFGHALGLDHLDDPDALMYRLNQEGKEEITAGDVAALKEVCRFE